MAPNRDGHANDGTTDGAGVTRWGWTYPTWCDAMNYAGQGHRATVTYFAQMSEAQAGTLAESYFWDRGGGNKLPGGPDVMVIDWFWNSGAGGVMEIQAHLNLPTDGIVGPATIAAIEKMGAGLFIDACRAWRIAYLDSIGFRKRFPGLYTRTDDCRTLAASLL